MAESTEQARPLAPAAFQSISNEEEALSTQLKLRQRKYIKCCGCFTAFFLILAVTILVLFFTVFHVKDPVIRISNLPLDQLELPVLPNGTFSTGTNVTLVIDISVKNRNMASFKFNNGTTTVLYSGTVVGEGMTPSGKAKARRTIHMNVTVIIIPEKILQVPRWVTDLSSKKLTMTSNTIIDGKVKILEIVKKHLTVEVNCTITYHFSSQDIENNCRPHFI
ncbi:hypothetical protein P3X46_016781 [Hevea brasiliensis]|nr:uncharacterized protein LOC131183408 [Hevea brasiliensis]KAJ9173668.1 hypothetical protein P3X46_016781 [Hevea brasiliensis]